MIDKNNLNRVRGILSAKNGAEVPKYNTGGGIPAYNAQDVDFKTFTTQNNLSNSPLIWEQYQRLRKVVPEADLNTLSSYWSGQTALPNNLVLADVIAGKSSTTIPGANPDEGDPNASANQAAEVAAKAAEITTNKTAEGTTTTTTTTTTNGNTSLNGGQVTGGGADGGSGAQTGGGDSNGLNVLTPEQIKAQKKNAAIGIAGNVVSGAVQAIGSAVGQKQMATDSDLTKGISTAYDTAANLASNFGPVGQAVSTVMGIAKGAGDIIQELGGGTDQQTTVDKIMDSPFFSWNIGMLNGFAGKNADEFGLDTDTLSKVGSSYGGTAADLQEASDKAGKKYGLFSNKKRKEANEAIAQARLKQNKMAKIAGEAEDDNLLVQSMGTMAGLSNSMQLDGGYSQKYTYSAKQGGSLNVEPNIFLEWEPEICLEWEPQIELNWELPVFKEGGNIDIVEELEWIPEFKGGGSIEDSDIPEMEETVQKNVIPEGALHKNKHHMEHAEGLTKKGIPVIDDEGEQQAEIEHSEIIFTLEVTKKLEEYYEIFYSDESSNKEKEQAAIDAGKLLVFQILENTEDRTGLIESCKKGGSLTLKTTTDDLIEEVLEGEPTMVIIEEKEVEEKPKKKKEKSDKELMKEAIKEALIELLIK